MSEELKRTIRWTLEEIELERRPITYKIYKGAGGKQGCFQFTLSPAYKPGAKRPEGAVFIEAAPATGPNVYDWDKKIVFALSANDIATVLSGFQSGKFELFHDPDAQTERKGSRAKRLTLEAGQLAGTFFLNLSEKVGEETKWVKISLQPGEARGLVTLLTAALPRILGWM